MWSHRVVKAIAEGSDGVIKNIVVKSLLAQTYYAKTDNNKQEPKCGSLPFITVAKSLSNSNIENPMPDFPTTNIPFVFREFSDFLEINKL